MIMINFDSTMPSIYWSDETRMSYLQRRIIVYSILYYALSVSLVSDHEYDSISSQLVEMKNKNPKAYTKTKYYYAMQDFDGSTGFYIYKNLNKKDQEYLMMLAKVLKEQRGLK